jgi:hypothetical protein
MAMLGFPTAVYSLCFVTSSICAWLLMRSYAGARGQMLFWSALCFVLLALNNLIVVIDLTMLPELDLSLARQAASFIAVGLLVFGFIWRGDEA